MQDKDDIYETKVFTKTFSTHNRPELSHSRIGTNVSAPSLRITKKECLKRTVSAPFCISNEKEEKEEKEKEEKGKEELKEDSIVSKKLYKKEKHLELIAAEKRIRNEIIQDNNGWNTDLEIIVANIGEKAGGYKWMHTKAMTYYSFWYHIFGVTSILLSGASGTTILTQVSSCNIDPITREPAQNWVLILVGIIMYLTAVVASIQQFKMWGHRSEKHQQGEGRFGELEHDIRIMLGSYRRDRDAGREYAKGVSKTFDDLILSYPAIPPHIQKQYSLRVLKLEQEGEKIADTDVIEKIRIIEEKEDKMSKKETEETPNPITPPDIRIEMNNQDEADSELLDSISLRNTTRYVSIAPESQSRLWAYVSRAPGSFYRLWSVSVLKFLYRLWSRFFCN